MSAAEHVSINAIRDAGIHVTEESVSDKKHGRKALLMQLRYCALGRAKQYTFSDSLADISVEHLPKELTAFTDG